MSKIVSFSNGHVKVTEHIEYDLEFEFEEALDGSIIVPKCTECGSSVDRPKCFFELGSDCPRHDVADALTVARKENLKKLGHVVVGSSSNVSPLGWKCISKDCYSYPCSQPYWMQEELASPKTTDDRRNQLLAVWKKEQQKFRDEHPSKKEL